MGESSKCTSIENEHRDCLCIATKWECVDVNAEAGDRGNIAVSIVDTSTGKMISLAKNGSSEAVLFFAHEWETIRECVAQAIASIR